MSEHSTGWAFPEESMDVGLVEMGHGKFVGLIFDAHGENPVKYALPADAAIRIAKAMAWVGLEIQGKVKPSEDSPTVPSGGMKN
jgi:hypothetical protein